MKCSSSVSKVGATKNLSPNGQNNSAGSRPLHGHGNFEPDLARADFDPGKLLASGIEKSKAAVCPIVQHSRSMQQIGSDQQSRDLGQSIPSITGPEIGMNFNQDMPN
jgi:hypothetical protein